MSRMNKIYQRNQIIISIKCVNIFNCRQKLINMYKKGTYEKMKKIQH